MNQIKPTLASFRHVFVAVFLIIALPITAGLAAQAPPGNEAEVDAYLDRYEAEIVEKLKDYNSEHAVVSTWNTARFVVHSRQVEGVEGDRAWVTVQFSVGGGTYKTPGNALFQLQWRDGGYQVAGHQTIAAGSETHSVAQDPGLEATPPLRDLVTTEAYIEQSLQEITSKLRAYNERNNVLSTSRGNWKVTLQSWRLERVAGDRAFVRIDYKVGDVVAFQMPGSFLFELAWVDDDLEFVAYQKTTTRAKITGGPDPGHDGCTFNYYSPRPCLEVMRKWSEFAALHDLPLNEESAAVLQAYKQLDYDRGDELMATVKGLKPPVESSVFALQNEVTAMNLPGPGRETDCTWNPYAPKPCPEALRIFRDFAKRHGLEANQASANMFDAYTRGDFKKADVIYALAKNLDVPAYGHIPTGAARDLASRWPETNRMELYGGIECEMNPHAAKPCRGVVPLWREFAARYGLEDIPDNGRIFEAYYEGNFEKGDIHLAEAYGVPLETLMEAAGVPSRDLTIEVYPGWRQMLRDLLVGT